MSPHFRVKRGGQYRAVLRLTGMETWASNEYVANEFRKAGFSNVVVTGGNTLRAVVGWWHHADADAPLPAQVIEVKALFEPVDKNVIYGPWR